MRLASVLMLAAAASAAGQAYEDWYPSDITPPPGTRYHCALTALPRELPGIPAADRRFINHTYAMLLKATQAKLVLTQAMESSTDLASPLEVYLRVIDDARNAIAAEPAPEGLTPFVEDVLQALELQQASFRAAVARRAKGEPAAVLYQIPEGRTASRRLISAWMHMQRRYPAWDAAVGKSVYHHLCALDFF